MYSTVICSKQKVCVKSNFGQLSIFKKNVLVNLLDSVSHHGELS